MVLRLSCGTRRAIPSVRNSFILALTGSQSQRGLYILPDHGPSHIQEICGRYVHHYAQQNFSECQLTTLIRRFSLPWIAENRKHASTHSCLRSLLT